MRKRAPPAAALALSADAATAWINKWQKTAGGTFWIVSEAKKLTLCSIVLGHWIIKVTWNAERIIISEHDGVSVYEFQGFNTAFTFLDALLLHHVVVSEERLAGRQPQTAVS